MTALGMAIPRAWQLYIERMKVVLAKEKRPLWRLSGQYTYARQAGGGGAGTYRGPGLPIFLSGEGPCT